MRAEMLQDWEDNKYDAKGKPLRSLKKGDTVEAGEEFTAADVASFCHANAARLLDPAPEKTKPATAPKTK